MYVAFGMNVVNLAGNYAVIFRPLGLPEFGVRGVAATAVIAQIAGAVAMWVIVRKKIGVSVSPKSLRPFPSDILSKILSIGLPAAGDNASYNLSQLVVTAIVASFGAGAIAAKIYVQNTVFFVYALGLSLGQGSQILIGHLVGAGRADEAHRHCMRYLKIAVVSNSLLSLACVFLSRYLLGFFTRDPEILRLACLVLAADFFVESGRAFNNILANTLRGAGDVRFPAVVSILSSWIVCVGLSCILGIVFHFGLLGAWVAFAVDEWFRGLVLLRRWKSGAWKRAALESSVSAPE
jgi:Na+-driven multidrug efflux pump